MSTSTQTTILTVQLFGRTKVTEHATEAEAFDHIGKIAMVNQLRVERDDTHNEGEFVPQVWIGTRMVDDPSCTWNYGGYRFAKVAA